MALNDITVYQTEDGFVVEFGGEGEDSIAVTLRSTPELTSENAVLRAKALLAAAIEPAQSGVSGLHAIPLGVAHAHQRAAHLQPQGHERLHVDDGRG